MRCYYLALPLVFFSLASVAAAPTPEMISLAELVPAELLKRVENLEDSANSFSHNKSEKKQFSADIEALAQRLAGKTAFAEFSQAEQLEIINAYESLRARAADAQSSRRTCERIRTLGSRMVKTVCLTQAEREQASKNSQERLGELQRKSSSSDFRSQ